MKEWKKWKEEVYLDEKVRKEFNSELIINLEELDIKLLMFLNGDIEWGEVEDEINFVKYRFGRIRKSK